MFRALVLAATLLATPASATEWVHCADAGGEASFEYLAGDGLDILSIAAITITTAEKVWASDAANGPGDPVAIGQAFEDADSVRIDAMAPDLSAKIAELRLFKATEGDKLATGGTLRIPGMGAWSVACEAPDAG